MRCECSGRRVSWRTSTSENVRMNGKAVDITEQILGAAIAVHRALGPGLLESAYEACLAFELVDRGLAIVRQTALPVVYRGVRIDCGYRLDLVVEGEVIVEIKAVERILPVHEAQILTYLKLSELPVALLLNFNVPLLKDGIKRFVGHPAVWWPSPVGAATVPGVDTGTGRGAVGRSPLGAPQPATCRGAPDSRATSAEVI